MKALPIQYDESIPAWEKAIYAFLAEKERRSGSMRTVDAYSRQLQRFFGTTGKTPEQITPPDVFGFAHGIGPSGREPAAITIGARLACISSFYRFLIRMDIVTRNPCDQLERPKVSASPPRGLSANDIRRLLAAIPETPSGRRDRSIVITLALTGRRRTEVLNLKVRGHHPGRRRLLPVSWEGRQAGQARIAAASIRGYPGFAHRLGRIAGHNGAG